jgi:hypothetical protein
MPAKRQRTETRSKIDWPGHWLKLAGHPLLAVPGDNCPEKVVACIKHQSGGQDLSNNPQIGKIGVDSGLLARCINDNFGTNYTKDDFPSTMTVLGCVRKVCGSS